MFHTNPVFVAKLAMLVVSCLPAVCGRQALEATVGAGLAARLSGCVGFIATLIISGLMILATITM